MSELTIISADSHANEPEETYDRLPEEYRESAPHYEVIYGKWNLIYDGQRPSPFIRVFGLLGLLGLLGRSREACEPHVTRR